MGLFKKQSHHRHSGNDVILDYSMSSLEKTGLSKTAPENSAADVPETAKPTASTVREAAPNTVPNTVRNSSSSRTVKGDDLLSDIKTVEQIMGTAPVVTSAEVTNKAQGKAPANTDTAIPRMTEKPTAPTKTDARKLPVIPEVKPVSPSAPATHTSPSMPAKSTAAAKPVIPSEPVAEKPRPKTEEKNPLFTEIRRTTVSVSNPPDAAKSVAPEKPREKSDKPLITKEAAELPEKSPVAQKPPVTSNIPPEKKKAVDVPKSALTGKPKKKHILDTTAQTIYDRMMAERAKNSIDSDTTSKKPARSSNIPKTSDKSYGAKAADEIVNRVASGISSDISFRKTRFSDSTDKPKVIKTPPVTQKTREAEYDDVPKIADDILFNIKRGKSYFTSKEKAASPISPKEKSENAAKIADEILTGLKHNSETAPASDGTKLYTGNIDESPSTTAPVSDAADGATRIIDLDPASDRINSSRRSEIKLNLQKLAEENEQYEEKEVFGGTKLKFNEFKEEELPESDVSLPREEKPIVDDYTTVDDAESVETDLSSKSFSLTARIIPTAIITVILFVVDFFLKDTIISSSPAAYTWINLLALTVGIVINFNTLRGLGGVIFNSPDMDTPAAIGVTATALYSFIAAIGSKFAELPNLIVPAMLVLLFNLFGKYLNIKRIIRGFRVIANDNPKHAVTFVEDRISSSVMANGSVIGEALICTGKKTVNIEDYLKNSYAPDPYEKKLSPVILFSLIAGAVLALAAFFTCSSLWAALAAFSLVTLAACPPATLLICNLPFYYTSKKLSSLDSMLAGHSATEKLSNANAVAFEASDIFPNGSIKLYSMQVLNKGSVDKYIAFAAAVLKEANSPLANIFINILNTNEEKTPEADSVKYEANMGVSGWIDDKRIFVGNRTLLEGHDIMTPSLELDKKILRKGCFPVYLAIDRTLVAMFIVGYDADEQITYELRRLCNTGITMLVTTSDPNISDKMLCDYFGLYPDSIKIMTSAGDAAYKKASAYCESVSAGGSFGDNISGFLATVTAAVRMKSLTDLLMIFEIVYICLGMAITGIFALSGTLMTIPVLLFSGFQLLTALITWIITHFKKP